MMGSRLFSKKHLWVLKDGNTATIGLSDFLQEKLGAIMFVNLPEIGDILSAGEIFGDVESKKTVMEMESPINGEVLEINEDVVDEPDMINDEPYESWLVKVRIDSLPDDLSDEAAYNKSIQQPWMQNNEGGR